MKNWPVYLLVLLGALLFAVEGFFLFDVPVWQAIAVTLFPAAAYALLTWAELSFVGRKRAEHSGTLVGAYMLFKGIRLLLTIVAVAVYIYTDAPLRMPFVSNVLILFLVALLTTSICHLREERREPNPHVK